MISGTQDETQMASKSMVRFANDNVTSQIPRTTEQDIGNSAGRPN